MDEATIEPWLHAFHDPLAHLNAFSACIATCDIYNDDDYRLLVADGEKKLKVYRGTVLASEHPLLEEPCAVTTWYNEPGRTATANVAVAAGSYVYIYRSLRPYYKFTLPVVDLNVREKEIWQEIAEARIDNQKAIEYLNEMRESGIELSYRSSSILTTPDQTEQFHLIDQLRSVPLIQMTVATCMTTIQKNFDDERAVSSLVIGTENSEILILDPSGTSISKRISLPAPPVQIAVNGLQDVDYRLIVSCRDGRIYTVKQGKLLATPIEPESPAVAIGILESSVLVACMNQSLNSYSFKGKRQYSLYLPSPITNMEIIQMKQTRHVHAVLVAMMNGEIRMYSKKTVVATIHCNETITAMRFGRYGREDSSLIIVGKSGALDVKILSRHAKMDVNGEHSGPPPEQDIPLNIPKKSKLYVEQTSRERENAIDIHRTFQRDLCKLRVETARAYVNVLMAGGASFSNIGGSILTLHASVIGLGPKFKLHLKIRNTGQKMVLKVPIIIAWTKTIYSVPHVPSVIPCLIPGMEYIIDLDVHCINIMAAPEAIRVYICNLRSSIPSITAVVNMPMCGPAEE